MVDPETFERLRERFTRLPEILQGLVVLVLAVGGTVVISTLVAPAWPLQFLIEHAPGTIRWVKVVFRMDLQTLAFVVGGGLIAAGAILYWLSERAARHAEHEELHPMQARMRLLFVANVTFLVGFVLARAIVIIGGLADDPSPTAAKGAAGSWWPFGELWLGGYHIHHFFYGFLILLTSGWIALFHPGVSRWIPAALYGLGVGIFVDEFTLLVTMGNYYGRSSWFAGVIFLALLVAGMVWTWGQARARREPQVEEPSGQVQAGEGAGSGGGS